MILKITIQSDYIVTTIIRSSNPKEHVIRALSVKCTACRFASALVGHCNSIGSGLALAPTTSSARNREQFA